MQRSKGKEIDMQGVGEICREEREGRGRLMAE